MTEQAKLQIGGDMSQVDKLFKKVGSELNKTGKAAESTASRTSRAFSSIFQGFGLGIGMSLYNTVKKLIGDAFAGAQEQIAADKTIEIALKRKGLAWEDYKDGVNKTLRELQTKSSFGDEEMQFSLARLLNMGLQAEDMYKGLGLAMDLSAITGMDLASSAQQIGMAYNGMGRQLKRFGIDIKETDKGAKSLDIMLEKISKNKLGAAAFEKAMSEPFKKLKNEIGDLYQQLGVPIYMAIEPKVKKLVDIMTIINTEGFEKTIQKLFSPQSLNAFNGALIKSGEQFMMIIAKGFDTILPAIGNSLKLSAQGLVSAIAKGYNWANEKASRITSELPTEEEMQEYTRKFGGKKGVAASEFIKTQMKDSTPETQAQALDMFKNFNVDMKTIYEGTMEAIDMKLEKKMLDTFTKIGDDFASMIPAVKDNFVAIKDAWAEAADTVKKQLGGDKDKKAGQEAVKEANKYDYKISVGDANLRMMRNANWANSPERKAEILAADPETRQKRDLDNWVAFQRETRAKQNKRELTLNSALVGARI